MTLPAWLTPERVNWTTRWVVVLGTFVAWGIYELVLLLLRRAGLKVDTISMAAKGLAFGAVPALAFFWCGMAGHYFSAWFRHPVWSTPYPAIAWWLMLVAYVVTGVVDRGHYFGWPLVMQWLRWPPVAGPLGFVSAYILFPQSANWVPEGLMHRPGIPG